jgi:site-specific DNA-methyltransferase (adenine-specific)
MPMLADKSVDMILCDLPYGTTACKWDTIIPFEPLWKQYKRLIKDNGAIVLTASQPFTSALVMSNPVDFRYSMVWQKEQATNFMFLKKQIGKVHEDILIFYQAQPIYNPQMITGMKPSNTGSKNQVKSHFLNGGTPKREGSTDRFPISILKIDRNRDGLHPTQKPVALFEYLIRTYTNEGDTVLDNCAGSGTTGVACLNTGRKFILIEKDAGYCEIIRRRIANHEPLLQAVDLPRPSRIANSLSSFDSIRSRSVISLYHFPDIKQKVLNLRLCLEGYPFPRGT